MRSGQRAGCGKILKVQQMSDDQKKISRGPLGVWLIAGAMLLPFAYVLSYGPALVLVEWGWIEYPYTALNWFYKPLDYIIYVFPAFGTWLRWYADLWTG